MLIESSTIDDIPTIFDLYEKATAYQKIKFPDNLWPSFEHELIRSEILEKKQWKLLIDEQVACIWATTFSDPMIWEERNLDPAVYIHRIATNQNFRGHKFVEAIVKWATSYALENNKQYIRMDTCGNNKRLIEYYGSCGFEFLGIHKLKSAEGLPSHYQDADVCFFEIDLKQK